MPRTIIYNLCINIKSLLIPTLYAWILSTKVQKVTWHWCLCWAWVERLHTVPCYLMLRSMCCLFISSTSSQLSWMVTCMRSLAFLNILGFWCPRQLFLAYASCSVPTQATWKHWAIGSVVSSSGLGCIDNLVDSNKLHLTLCWWCHCFAQACW
jgi:hypothetical protein